MATRLRRTFIADLVEHEPASSTVRFSGHDFGPPWSFTLSATPGGALLTDAADRASKQPITSWILGGGYAHFRLTEGAQATLALDRVLAIDLRKVDPAALAVEDSLRTLLGPSEADVLRLVVEEVFHIKHRSGPVLVCRLEAGSFVMGQRVAIALPDGRGDLGQVVSFEMHSREGTAGLVVRADSGVALTPGTIITSHRG